MVLCVPLSDWMQTSRISGGVGKLSDVSTEVQDWERQATPKMEGCRWLKFICETEGKYPCELGKSEDRGDPSNVWVKIILHVIGASLFTDSAVLQT